MTAWPFDTNFFLPNVIWKIWNSCSEGFCFKPQQAHGDNFAEGKLAKLNFKIHLYLQKDHKKQVKKL